MYDPEIIDVLNLEKLQPFLDDYLPGKGEPFAIRRLTGGATNLLFELQRHGQRWVLRRPPKVPISPTAHNMMREAQVLRALAGTDVPHPKLIVANNDKSILGVDFYVMAFVDGFSPETRFRLLSTKTSQRERELAIHSSRE